jgi:hypothetical protein
MVTDADEDPSKKKQENEGAHDEVFLFHGQCFHCSSRAFLISSTSLIPIV